MTTTALSRASAPQQPPLCGELLAAGCWLFGLSLTKEKISFKERTSISDRGLLEMGKKSCAHQEAVFFLLWWWKSLGVDGESQWDFDLLAESPGFPQATARRLGSCRRWCSWLRDVRWNEIHLFLAVDIFERAVPAVGRGGLVERRGHGA